jgi:hypothetical protein
MKFTPHAAHIQYTCYVPCRHSWIHGGMCVQISNMWSWSVQNVFLSSLVSAFMFNRRGRACLFKYRESSVCNNYHEKEKLSFCKAKVTRCSVESGLGTHWWWLTGIAPVSDPGTSKKVLGFKLTGVQVKALPALLQLDLTWWCQWLVGRVCCCTFKN